MLNLLSNALQQYYHQMNAEPPEHNFARWMDDEVSSDYDSDDIVMQLNGKRNDPRLANVITGYDKNFPLRDKPNNDTERYKMIIDVFNEIIDKTDKFTIPYILNSSSTTIGID